MALRNFIFKNLLSPNVQNIRSVTTTHYGFETVNVDEKQEKVNTLFENIAKDYDLMIDALSFGVHRLWREYFIWNLSPVKGTKLLDGAGGTGDIAFRFINYVERNKIEDCHVTVTDINPHMLEVGKNRSKTLCHNPNLITWQEGNAEELPFSDDSFNAYTIAFGVRNCTHIDKILSEAYRVLQPGGRFLCLELNHQLECSAAQKLYDIYSFQVLPVLGHLVSGKSEPYHYLVGSIRNFPKQVDFKQMIEEAGFRQVTYENLNLGVVAIHSGFKL